MTVAFDAATEPATFTTTTPYTFSHTPSGTPAGILLEIDHGAVSTDLITGTVSYGGVAMSRVATAKDTATEAGRSYFYFLGSGIPSGTQTVSISHTGSSDVKHTTVASVTAAADTEIGGAGGWSENITNPAVTLGRYQEGLGFVVVYSGTPNVSDLTPLTGMTAISDNDYGAFMSRFDRETTASTGAFPIGYTTALNDDVALCAVSIQEQQSGCYPAGAMSPITGVGLAATTFTMMMQGQLNGTDLYTFVVSRDSTSASADVTCTDDSGANTWTSVAGDADKKAWVFWKRGTTSDIGATVTIAAAVGSTVGSIVCVKGGNGAGGDPTTNMSVETNASGNETHAGMTPSNSNSTVMFAVMDYGNDTNAVTSLSGATMGASTRRSSNFFPPAGSDCRITVTGRPLASGATGNITWSQTDSTTKSVLFAVAPGIAAVTGTGSSTLGDDTSAGTGTESMLATGASTLDGVTSAGSGSVVNPISGTGATTLDGVTSAGVGVEGFSATGASTLAGVSSAGAGLVANPVSGTGSSTLAGVTSSGSGVLGIIASGSSSLDGVVSQGSGIVANPVTGTGACTLGRGDLSGNRRSASAGPHRERGLRPPRTQ